MVIRKLKEAQNFSEIEKAIANYILLNGKDISKMSIRDLAEAVYVSTSTITRLCHKLGSSGYSEFKIQFNSEFKDNIKYSKEIDENVPFQKHDSLQNIVSSIANINIRGIEESLEILDYKNLDTIVQRMKNSQIIHIFGQGSSLMVAYEFKAKMLRMGKTVLIENDSSSQIYQAANVKKDDLAIVISYSGENKKVWEISNILKRNKIFFVAITAEKDNSIQKLASLPIYVGASEDKSLSAKLEIFSSYSATHFILDCLYACLYKQDYEKNYNASKTMEEFVKTIRQI